MGMVMIVDQSGIKDTPDFENQFIDRYLLNDELHGITTVVRRFLHERNTKELDLLMGVQGWRRFISTAERSEKQSKALGKYCRFRMFPYYAVDSVDDRMLLKSAPMNVLARSPRLYARPRSVMAGGLLNTYDSTSVMEEEAVPESASVETEMSVAPESGVIRQYGLRLNHSQICF